MKTLYTPWGALFGGLLSLVLAYFSAVLLLDEYKVWASILFGLGLLASLFAVYCSFRTVWNFSSYTYPVFAVLGASIGGFLGLASLAIFVVGQFF